MTNPDREELLGHADNLNQQANWIEEALAPETPDSQRIGIEDIDIDELRGASDLFRRLASSDGGVKVRELEWGYNNVAASSLGKYMIDGWSNGEFSIAIPGRYDNGTRYPTLDAAKAAAQADYEARIKSALVTAQPADAGMREALERSIRELEYNRANHYSPDITTINRLKDQVLVALTAPGATTKSDGGALSSLPAGESEPVVMQASLSSDPSSTRSDPNEQAYADLIASGGIFPEVYQQSEPSMTDDQIKHMVDRFLTWKLPKHFNPDCGISFDQSYRSEHGPVGTNLFDAVQATAMVRHMLEGLPSSTRSEVTVGGLARIMVHAVYPNSVGDRWFERDPVNLGTDRSSTVALAGEYARALLDQFEIRRK